MKRAFLAAMIAVMCGFLVFGSSCKKEVEIELIDPATGEVIE